ncbi:MAG: hypothetical protein EBR82_36230 [Caulobacteraceae bacterium]|nr:hypothetical protein [Caulobacteraceae bacterium]
MANDKEKTAGSTGEVGGVAVFKIVVELPHAIEPFREVYEGEGDACVAAIREWMKKPFGERLTVQKVA